MRRAQALVEFALLVPLFLLLIVAAIDGGLLVTFKADMDRKTALVAEWAADHPGESWNSVANAELSGCLVTVDRPQPDIVRSQATCRYRSILMGLTPWPNLPVSSKGSAVEQSRNDSPSPSPSASPSSSSTPSPVGLAGSTSRPSPAGWRA